MKQFELEQQKKDHAEKQLNVMKNENEKVEKEDLGMSQIMKNWNKPEKIDVIEEPQAEVSQVEKEASSGVNLADIIQINEPMQPKKKPKKVVEPVQPQPP